MKLEGYIEPMLVYHKTPIKYYLFINKTLLFVNDIIGKSVLIKYIYEKCKKCKAYTIYNQGYCKHCYFTAPEIYPAIIRPELSVSHLNIEIKNLQIEQQIELQPHTVYLSVTSNPKIGVTKKINVKQRWMNQGAIQAIKFIQTSNRYLAGKVEHFFKKNIRDKTNYRIMLKKKHTNTNLLKIKSCLTKFFFAKKFIGCCLDQDNKIYNFKYPIQSYPEQIKSITLKNKKTIKDKLVGIKGQYMIFKNGEVINIMKHQRNYVKIIIG